MGQMGENGIKPEDNKLPGEIFLEIMESFLALREEVYSTLKDTSLSPELRDKYRRVSEDLSIVSAYFRHRAKTAIGDAPLYKYQGGILIDFFNSLRKLPDQIRTEMRYDLGLSGIELAPEVGTGKLAELSNTVSKFLLQYMDKLETSTLFPEESETSPKEPDTKSDYLLLARANLVAIYITFDALNTEFKEFVIDKASPKTNNKYKVYSQFIDETVLPNLKEALDTITEKLSLDQIRQKYEWTRIIADQVLEVIADKDNTYKIESYKGRRVLVEFKSQIPESTSLSELKKLLKAQKPGNIRVPKDVVQSQIESVGDIMEIGTEKDRKTIENLQSRGKLLFGSMEGLSGGDAYFKSFSIALAKILNEQVKYYQTEKDWRGVSEEVTRRILGESANIETGDNLPVIGKENKVDSIKIKNESRPFPYVIISYKRLAEEMSKTGKISGGKDIEGIRRYINGGYTEFEVDPKTGKKKPVKSSYVPGLASKRYPVSTGDGKIAFIPYIVNEAEIVDPSRQDPEVGCLLRLSPQYSKGVNMRYTSFRSDTIQLIGGGRQKDITMDLLDLLVYTRGIEGGVYRKNKTELLARYKDKPTYSGRPGKLEKHFRVAVRKAIDAKVLLSGADKSGNLNGYREEKNTRGEIVCVFKFNPDYLKGEEIIPEVDNQ